VGSFAWFDSKDKYVNNWRVFVEVSCFFDGLGNPTWTISIQAAYRSDNQGTERI
jgi:hypothetical protein